MKLMLIFLLLFNFSTDPTEIARNNELKKKASAAFEQGDYQMAAQKYSMLYDTLGVEDPAVGLNLAHSYFALGDTSNAKLMYQNIVTTNNKKLKSIAYQQLGVMSKSPQTLNESLQYLKASLKANPMNEEARYNYEVVKKLIDQQQQQNQDQDQNQENQDQDQKDQDKQDQEQNNKDQQNQDQENQDQEQQDQQNQENQDEQSEEQDQQQQDQEGKEGEEQDQQQQKEGEEENDSENQEQQQQSTKEKLEEMNISEEKARMILEAMRNNEVQYIQQQKRRATQPQDSGKPDW